MANPFQLGEDAPYARWREAKLAAHPREIGRLMVEVGDIEAPTPAEIEALKARVRLCNMAVYAEARPRPGRDDKAALRSFGAALGLVRLDANALADDDGVTPLSVHAEGTRARYIPYTDRPIAWHTDGYYNDGTHRVRGLVLHCARPAAEGGANRLMDPEVLYILLRDEDPGHVAALMRPDAMTIPGNDEEGMRRGDTPGPVFIVEDGDTLAVRYTARARNVVWSPAPEVEAARLAIARLLSEPSPFVFTHRLEAGQGLVSNNVLHTRERFADDPTRPRLLYRARFHDRISP